VAAGVAAAITPSAVEVAYRLLYMASQPSSRVQPFPNVVAGATPARSARWASSPASRLRSSPRVGEARGRQ
jgi:hypothetical protein